MAPSKEFLAKISRLEAVERRWLWNIFSTLILGAVVLALELSHFDLADLLGRVPVQIAPTQFLFMIAAQIVMLISTIIVLIEYFTVSLTVELAVVIKKRRRASGDGEQEDDERG